MVENGDERRIREERFKKPIREVEKDPLAQKTILRLEPALFFSPDINKGKGLIFSYESFDSSTKTECLPNQEYKLLASAIQSGNAMR